MGWLLAKEYDPNAPVTGRVETPTHSAWKPNPQPEPEYIRLQVGFSSVRKFLGADERTGKEDWGRPRPWEQVREDLLAQIEAKGYDIDNVQLDIGEGIYVPFVEAFDNLPAAIKAATTARDQRWAAAELRRKREEREADHFYAGLLESIRQELKAGAYSSDYEVAAGVASAEKEIALARYGNRRSVDLAAVNEIRTAAENAARSAQPPKKPKPAPSGDDPLLQSEQQAALARSLFSALSDAQKERAILKADMSVFRRALPRNRSEVVAIVEGWTRA